MPESSLPEPTKAFAHGDDPLDAALAAAFGPDSGPPLPAGGSVVLALAADMPAVPRVLLREPAAEMATPVNLPNSPAMPPANLSGRLQLIGEIARGGMGAILKGRDVDLGRDIAVKVLLETHQGKTELAQRFIEEAQISGQLQHPGVAPVYELGILPDRRPYFTMKLVKGQTLAALLAARKDEEKDSARHLATFAQVCQTLAYAHARGVIHRDLKPSNVMVGAFGEVQVMDWGLAKVLQEGGIADERKTQQRQTVSIIRTQRSQGSGAAGSDAEAQVGSHTQAGSILGTPAYMAPEQARGDVELVDERADVFGLGAILCEILTGQPPFTGKGAEAQRKAQGARLDDAFARLGGCGADAELIALAKHCLAAEPWDRPRQAGAVAEAVADYQNSAAQRLRRAELERAAAEARAEEETRTRHMAEAKTLEERKRRRATLALAAALLALVVVGGGGAAWWWRQQTAVARDVEAALAAAADHGQAGRWPQARAVLERAESRLGDAIGTAPAELRDKVGQARTDLNFVAQLEEIRLRSSEHLMFGADPEATPKRYADAFRAYGIDVADGAVDTVATRLRASSIRETLLGFMDAWYATVPAEKRGRLLAVLQAADDSAWRRIFREAWAAKDNMKIEQLAAQEEALKQPPAILNLLAHGLREAGFTDKAVAIARQAQRRYPGDFWINHNLANFLDEDVVAPRPEEAASYMRVAVAIRPDSALAHNSLGVILTHAGDWQAASAEFREAIALAPDDPLARSNLGLALNKTGDPDGALRELRRALLLAPKNALFQSNIAATVYEKGNVDEAIVLFREALAFDPGYAPAHAGLGDALLQKNDWPAATAAYREAVRLDPKNAHALNNLGVLLLKKNDLDGALDAFERTVKHNPKLALAHRNIGAILKAKNNLNASVAAYRRAVAADPRDADAYLGLGDALAANNTLDEAAEAYRQGIRLNPKSIDAHTKLGDVLRQTHDPDGAMAAFEEALALNPKSAYAHMNIGTVWHDKKDFDAAIAAYRRALTFDSKYTLAHKYLAIAMVAKKDFDGAIASYRQFLALEPTDVASARYLSMELVKRSGLEEARAAWKKALGGNPRDHSSWFCYAELCLFLGEEADYYRARRDLLERFGSTTDPTLAERTARACLLLPAAGNELSQAVALADRAVTGGAKHNYYVFFMAAKGLAEYRLDHHDSAIEWLNKAIAGGAAMPGRLVLAMAQHRGGKIAEARKTLAGAVSSYDWDQPSHVDVPDVWICHALRREAERLIVPNLEAFLKGDYQPKDNAERLRLAAPCVIQRRPLAAVRLCADALAADPKLADDLKAFHRYNAACFAALVAGGQGQDAAKLDDMERSRWRKQALDWLRADLGALSKQRESGNAEAQTRVRQRLKDWRGDSDLDSLRDPNTLTKLPATEREACQRLWADVAALLKKAEEKHE